VAVYLAGGSGADVSGSGAAATTAAAAAMWRCASASP
jgi:hypothetical protein